jgi:dCMP deaminase
MQTVTGSTGECAVYCAYLKQAYKFAQHSVDPSTQVGCVIVHPGMGVVSGAANAVPEGIAVTEERLQTQELKNVYMEHAERNALYKCAQSVLSSKGCHAYITLPPCLNCARGLIQSGITKVVAHKEMFDLYTTESSSSTRESIEHGWKLLLEAKVNAVLWSGRVFQIPTVRVRVRGRLWTP